MKLKAVSGIMLALFLIGMLTPAFNFQQVKASGTIYIKADGSVDPPSAPISSVDNVTYTFTGNINDSIVVERSNITVDGNGYTLQSLEGGCGFNLTSISNVTIQNTNIKNFNNGVWLISSSDNTVSGNNITNNHDGIWLSSSNCTTISGNDITNNRYGISLYWSSNNTISGNTVTENNDGGIGLGGSSNNTISGNNITENNGGGIWLSSSNCTTISGNKITENSDGIRLDESSNNTISGNNITNNRYGIYHYGSSYTTISGNKITDNHWAGVNLGSSSKNKILGNSLTNNSKGVELRWSSNNTICGNNITNDRYGISLEVSSNNNITANNMANNHDGIYLSSSSNNVIYHNNFVDNAQQAHIEPSGYANFWDDGYPSGGNYWSDYDGTDLYYGPYQNETGSDGIGDTLYVIGENNTDRYPLMKPYGVQHDIGITSITPSRTIIGQGYSLHVNIRIVNYGVNAETFNVTVYANQPPIATLTNITLTSRNSTTITFTWNTTSVPYGNYTISAIATPVPGETDIVDNSLIDGCWVLVTVAGDVNVDGIVDIFDGVPVVAALGAELITDPQDPRFGEYWHDETCPRCPHNPLADINQDGVIDGLDLEIVDNNYGKTW